MTNDQCSGRARRPCPETAGRLYSRAWARGTTTAYLMNAFGNVYGIDYSDGTPGATNSYDRLGRPTSVQDGTGTHLLSYDLAGRLLTETNRAGLLAGLGLASAFDSLGRRASAGLYSSSSLLASTSFGYDAGSRLSGVTNVNVAYTYLANSPLVEQIISRQSGTTSMTTTKSYDNLNRLTAISSAPSASSVVSFSYGYNNANQRTNVTLGPDRSYWAYGYDSLGQVIFGKKYWYDGVPFAGQQFEYVFDNIGNRNQTKAGGDSSGQNLRVAWYTNNLLHPVRCTVDSREVAGRPQSPIPEPRDHRRWLSHGVNQITNRTVPGSNDVIGIAHASATVAVNGQSPYRRGEYYRKELALANTNTAVFSNVTCAAILAGVTNTTTGKVFLAKSPEAFSYDGDGNLTQDGRWNYTWDGENRLIKMSTVTGTPSPWQGTNVFVYDCQGRRSRKKVYGSAGSVLCDVTFVYDGWNLIAELDNTKGTVRRSYLWGQDLSGTMDGAGGVGGLLAVVDASASAHHYAMFDGNGNVTGLVRGEDASVSARYEYGPFGEPIRVSGPMATANPLRWSTKFTDQDSDLVYYGCRHYNPATGRWLNRDPLQEEASLNLYAFLRNAPVNELDVDGQSLFQIMTAGGNATRAILAAVMLVLARNPEQGGRAAVAYMERNQIYQRAAEERRLAQSRGGRRGAGAAAGLAIGLGLTWMEAMCRSAYAAGEAMAGSTSQGDTTDASLVSFYRNAASGDNTASADRDAITAALEMTGGAAANATVAWETFEIAGEAYEQAVGQ